MGLGFRALAACAGREEAVLALLAGCGEEQQELRGWMEEQRRRTPAVTEKIEPALTAEFPTPAQRPLYSALDCALFQQTFELRLPDWREALKLTLDQG